MSHDPYNAVVRRKFASPQHAGFVEDGVTAYFNDQGLKIHFSASVTGTVLQRLRFLAWGCPHVIAAAETFCEQFEGRETQDLADFDVAEIMKLLAVPVEKTGRMLVIEDTVRSLRAAIGNQAAD